jgi:hypothetical protein
MDKVLVASSCLGKRVPAAQEFHTPGVSSANVFPSIQHQPQTTLMSFVLRLVSA